MIASPKCLQSADPFKGGIIAYGNRDVEMISGIITEFTPERRPAHTFRFHPSLLNSREEPETTVIFQLKPSLPDTHPLRTKSDLLRHYRILHRGMDGGRTGDIRRNHGNRSPM